MFDFAIPFAIGCLLGTGIFWRPALIYQNKVLRNEVRFLRVKVKEWERHCADLQMRLLRRDPADYWKDEEVAGE
jgi:hypothetical protein